MGVKIHFKGNTMIAELEGEIDHHNAKEIRESIDISINKKSPSMLNLDFGGIQFMDSSGIGLIMGRYKNMQLKGGKLRIINIPDHLERMIKLSGIGALGVIERGSEKNESYK